MALVLAIPPLMHPAKIKTKDQRPPTNHDAGAAGNYSVTSIAAVPLARHSPSSMADEARRVERDAFSRHNHHRMQSYAHRTCF